MEGEEERLPGFGVFYTHPHQYIPSILALHGMGCTLFAMSGCSHFTIKAPISQLLCRCTLSKRAKVKLG